MEEDFAESVHTFLEKTLSLHSNLHTAIENHDNESIQNYAREFSDACTYMGADLLSAKLHELLCQLNDYNQATRLKSIQEIDQIYHQCRQELLDELNKNLKQAV